MSAMRSRRELCAMPDYDGCHYMDAESSVFSGAKQGVTTVNPNAGVAFAWA